MTKPITWTPNAQDALKRLGNGRLFASPTEVAALFGNSPTAIRAACVAGQIPGIKLGDRWHVPVAWLRQVAGMDPDLEVAGPAA